MDDEDQTSLTAYIGNLPFDVSDADVRELMDPVTVKEVRLIKNRDTDRMKGYGFLEFKTEEDLRSALLKHEEMYRGRRLNLERCRHPPHPPGSGPSVKNSSSDRDHRADGRRRPRHRAREDGRYDDRRDRFDDRRDNRFDDRRGDRSDGRRDDRFDDRRDDRSDGRRDDRFDDRRDDRFDDRRRYRREEDDHQQRRDWDDGYSSRRDHDRWDDRRPAFDRRHSPDYDRREPLYRREHPDYGSRREHVDDEIPFRTSYERPRRDYDEGLTRTSGYGVVASPPRYERRLYR
eukprot:scpid89963/ scgid7257/ Eukaryotic translation initiation factor 4H; Williams-Beuren syndrome chromosomal region 1 protein